MYLNFSSRFWATDSCRDRISTTRWTHAIKLSWASRFNQVSSNHTLGKRQASQVRLQTVNFPLWHRWIVFASFSEAMLFHSKHELQLV